MPAEEIHLFKSDSDRYIFNKKKNTNSTLHRCYTWYSCWLYGNAARDNFIVRYIIQQVRRNGLYLGVYIRNQKHDVTLVKSAWTMTPHMEAISQGIPRYMYRTFELEFNQICAKIAHYISCNAWLWQQCMYSNRNYYATTINLLFFFFF